MTSVEPTSAAPRTDLTPTVRYHLFAGSIGLLTSWLAMFERGYGVFSLLPVALGAAAMATALLPPSWRALRIVRRLPVRALPAAAIFSIVPMEILFTFERPNERHFLRVSDVLLIGGLLSYLVPQFRLLGLVSAAVPTDARLRADRLGGDEPEPRPASSARPSELWSMAWIVPIGVVAGQLLWQCVLSTQTWRIESMNGPTPATMALPIHWWRLFVVLWLLAAGALGLGAAMSILRIYRMSADEAAAACHETLGHETRGEQRRIHRWLAWMRRKRGRTEGTLP